MRDYAYHESSQDLLCSLACTHTEYWLSSLKVATIIVFIILGIVVNVGGNQAHEYIGARNWHIPGAPFVGGFGGFARVFVTASFACACFPHSLMTPLLRLNYTSWWN